MQLQCMLIMALVLARVVYAYVAFPSDRTPQGAYLRVAIAVNRGKAHAQISNVSLAYADGSLQLIGSGLVGYVLPDRNRQWKLPLPTGASAVQGPPRQVRAMVNGQEMQVAL